MKPHFQLNDLLGVTVAGFTFTINEFLGAISLAVVIWATLPLGIQRWRDVRAGKRGSEK